ncbi:hypothetical protein ABIB82_004103 [Bradyrhizobium sp. i1.8.4]
MAEFIINVLVEVVAGPGNVSRAGGGEEGGSGDGVDQRSD